MSGTKKFVNKTTEKLKVRIFVRKGDDPSNGDSGKEVFVLDAGQSSTVTYGKETGDIFLNGISVAFDDRGADCGYALTVATRGNWIDDILNTNSVITIHSASTNQISGSNQ